MEARSGRRGLPWEDAVVHSDKDGLGGNCDPVDSGLTGLSSEAKDSMALRLMQTVNVR